MGAEWVSPCSHLSMGSSMWWRFSRQVYHTSLMHFCWTAGSLELTISLSLPPETIGRDDKAKGERSIGALTEHEEDSLATE